MGAVKYLFGSMMSIYQQMNITEEGGGTVGVGRGSMIQYYILRQLVNRRCGVDLSMETRILGSQELSYIRDVIYKEMDLLRKY